MKVLPQTSIVGRESSLILSPHRTTKAALFSHPDSPKSIATESTACVSSDFFNSASSLESEVRFCTTPLHIDTLHRNDMTEEERSSYWWSCEEKDEIRNSARRSAIRFGRSAANKAFIVQLNLRYDEIRKLSKDYQKKSTTRLLAKPSLYTEDTLEEWVCECGGEHRGLERLCSSYLRQQRHLKAEFYVKSIVHLQWGEHEDRIARYGQALSLRATIWARAMAEADALAAHEF